MLHHPPKQDCLRAYDHLEFSDKSSDYRVENRLQRVQDLRQGVHQDAAERIQVGKESSPNNGSEGGLDSRQVQNN